jgi:hypothetical protein
MARRRESAARKLLRIKSEGRPLRAVPALRKCAFDGLALKVTAEAGHEAEIPTLHAAALELDGRKFKRAQPLSRLRPRTRGTRLPRVQAESVYVDADFVGNINLCLAAEPKLVSEEEEQSQHDDNQQDDGQDSSAASTAIGFDDCRAFHFVTIVRHHFTPCQSVVLAKRTKLAKCGSDARIWNILAPKTGVSSGIRHRSP